MCMPIPTSGLARRQEKQTLAGCTPDVLHRCAADAPTVEGSNCHCHCHCHRDRHRDAQGNALSSSPAASVRLIGV